MTQSDPNNEHDEKPLDPAVERIQGRLRRLLGFSSLIMLLGFASVIAAIAYKLNERSETKSAGVPDLVTEENMKRGTYPIPVGSNVTGMQMDGERLAISYDGPDGSGVLMVDIPSWQVYADMKLPTK